MRPILPSEVPKHWKDIRPVIEKMSKVSDGWLPEDVYTTLVTGGATLYLEAGVEGFIILQLQPHYAGKRLHIWIAYCRDDPLRFMPEVKEIARAAGAGRITFESPRKGWGLRAARYGFLPSRIVYEQEV
jgi:hypothetical protein